MVEAQCQRFEVRSSDGERVLFSADEQEISIGTEKLKVTGNVKRTHTTPPPFLQTHTHTHTQIHRHSSINIRESQRVNTVADLHPHLTHC